VLALRRVPACVTSVARVQWRARMRRASAVLMACWGLACASTPQADALPESDPRVQALLHGPTLEEQTRAMEELVRVGAPAVPALARLLESPAVDDVQGAWIAETLGEIGPPAAPAARALATRLMKGGDCSATTSWALGELGAAGVPWLVRALKDGQPKGRVWAAQYLRQHGLANREAVSALLAALRDDVADVRESAVWTLGCMDPPTPAVEAALRNALRDKDEDVRYAASDVLGLDQ